MRRLGIDPEIRENRIMGRDSTMIPKILFIGHSYHQVTKSSAFFLERLELMGQVITMFDDCAGGVVRQDYFATAAPYDIVVVWQLPKVISQFAISDNRRNIVYVPMFDAVFRLGPDFWQSLKHIKIVCFSNALQAICLTHGLDSFFIQYYPEWMELAPAGYITKSLFFWQRRASPNWETVSSILPPAQFHHMHHHVAIDPGFEVPLEQLVHPAESEIASGRSGISDWFPNKADLLDKLKRCNLFFLPREREGIGMSFLDAMKTGLVPVGFDRSTYNEYVVDGLNGFIVGKQQQLVLPDIHPIAQSMRHYMLKGRMNYLRRLKGLGSFVLRTVKEPDAPRCSVFQIGPKFFRRWTNRYFTGTGKGRQALGNREPLISIIVIVKNEMSGFLVTHESICGQSFGNIEYIVMDRYSTDGTRERVRCHQASIDQLIDGGKVSKSSAMKIAANKAKGRYLLFLNAGNEFAGSTSLEEAVQDAPPDADIIYGHHYGIRPDSSVKLMLVADLNKICHPLRVEETTNDRVFRFPCQQAVLLSKKIFLADNLLLGGRASDHHQFLREACRQGAKTYHSNTVIVRC